MDRRNESIFERGSKIVIIVQSNSKREKSTKSKIRRRRKNSKRRDLITFTNQKSIAKPRFKDNSRIQRILLKTTI